MHTASMYADCVCSRQNIVFVYATGLDELEDECEHQSCVEQPAERYPLTTPM